MLKKHILLANNGLHADASANGRTASLACVPFKSRLETVVESALPPYVGASAAAFNLVSCAESRQLI